MEAPEKVYLSINAFGEVIKEQWQFHRLRDDDVKYLRADVFIEKAEEFIYSALNDGIMGTANIEDFMRLFKKCMKGE